MNSGTKCYSRMNLLSSNSAHTGAMSGGRQEKDFYERYTVQTMKHQRRVMKWGATSVNGTAGLFSVPTGTTMNGLTYIDLLKDKLEVHMAVHNCIIFMQDSTPCHHSNSFDL